MATDGHAATCGQCKHWQEKVMSPGMGFCQHPDAMNKMTASRVSVACYLVPRKHVCMLKG